MAKVMISGGRPKYPMPSPFTAPIPAATISASAIAPSPVASTLKVTNGRMIAVTVMIALTERSIPPPITAMVWPMPTRPITAASSTI